MVKFQFEFQRDCKVKYLIFEQMNCVRPVERVDVIAAERVGLARVVQTESPAVGFLERNLSEGVIYVSRCVMDFDV